MNQVKQEKEAESEFGSTKSKQGKKVIFSSSKSKLSQSTDDEEPEYFTKKHWERHYSSKLS